MKRRTFCASSVAALSLAAIPWRRSRAVDLPALGPGERQIVIPGSDVDALRAGMRGEVLIAGQQGYDSVRRVWNGAFDRHPAVIARCAGAADVRLAVQFGRTHELLVAVRGGGHSLSGQSVCEGGLMIDLSPMKSVHVDPIARVARVEAGVLLGQFDREAQAFGLATTAGTVSHTGAAGLTLGGGFGRIGRKFGLACDNMFAADVITAGGQFVKAGEKENADLLWGLRGGGGNFGVVTSFEYHLHDVGPLLYGGQLIYPWVDVRELMTFYTGFIATAPDELYCDVLFVPTPDGHRAVIFDFCYFGTEEGGARVLEPLRKFRKPMVDGAKLTPYLELQRSSDDAFPIGRSYYMKAGFLKQFDGSVIDTAIGIVNEATVPRSACLFPHAGGAISRIKPDATAFLHRKVTYGVALFSFWDTPQDREPSMQWARGAWPKLEPLTEGFYVNELSADDPERRIKANYGSNYDRLVKLKNKYDPTNLFLMNANVKPTA